MRIMEDGFNAGSIQIPGSFWDSECTLSLDIGGSLAKVAYIMPGIETKPEKELTVHLITFHTDYIEQCFTFIETCILNKNNIGKYCVRTIGVGCCKYRERLCEIFKHRLLTDDNEMYYASRGMDVLCRHLDQEKLLHECSDKDGIKFHRPIAESGLGPCILVNLGSAMTAVKVDENGCSTNYVGGCTLGGLSFLGIGALMTGAKTFTELVRLAGQGDHKKVDLLVQDTAGESYYNAPPEGMVSSFGKAARDAIKGNELAYSREDLASSALYAITDNMAMHSYFVARCEGLDRICFCGSYLTGNEQSMIQIQDKLRQASLYLGFQVKGTFFRYEAYLGVLGALFSWRKDNKLNQGVLTNGHDENIATL